MKIRVKMLDSIAGLADPKSNQDLDRKHEAAMQQMNKGREKAFSREFTERQIADMRKRDRYGEKPLGFPRDWSFKTNDEPMINEELARKWEEAGLCLILDPAAPAKKAA